MWYKLDRDNNPVVTDTPLDFDTRWKVKTEKNGVVVSTVFMGLDHSLGVGPPVLFETMVFMKDGDDLMWRYTNIEDAMLGHYDACVKYLNWGGK